MISWTATPTTVLTRMCVTHLSTTSVPVRVEWSWTHTALSKLSSISEEESTGRTFGQKFCTKIKSQPPCQVKQHGIEKSPVEIRVPLLQLDKQGLEICAVFWRPLELTVGHPQMWNVKISYGSHGFHGVVEWQIKFMLATMPKFN